MARMIHTHKDRSDNDALRHGYTTHVGADGGDTTMGGVYPHGQYCPMFFNREGATLSIEGMYRGASCFLIGGGPSLNLINTSLLTLPGVLTLAMNNSVKVVRPTMWTAVDDPSRFLYSIYRDPKIMKFEPQAAFEKPLWISTNTDGHQNWKKAPELVGDCPNVIGYRRNEKFNAEQFLTESTINWGCHKEFGGCRSVMLAAFRILFLLGIRRLYLVGVDLNMSPRAKYAFNEGRTDSAIKNNNDTYERMIHEYFPKLKPHFDAAGFQVFNCNLESKLTTFPFMPYDEAIKEATKDLGDLDRELTEGMYLKMDAKLGLGSWEECRKAVAGAKGVIQEDEEEPAAPVAPPQVSKKKIPVPTPPAPQAGRAVKYVIHYKSAAERANERCRPPQNGQQGRV